MKIIRRVLDWRRILDWLAWPVDTRLRFDPRPEMLRTLKEKGLLKS